MFSLKNAFIIAILLLAFSVRIFRLDMSPEGALIDEAHFGYLAYSLIETGADEHGVRWPLIFQGFGDQKLPGYAYLMIPFVAVLDLSVFSIRVPSVLLGVASTFGVLLLARKAKFPFVLQLIAGVIMAVSPWPFFLSRIGFESNLALFFFVFGLVGLLHILTHQKKTRYWWALPVFSGGFLALTWYSYIAYRPVTFLLLGSLAVLMWVKQRKITKQFILALATFSVLILPFFLSGASSSNTARFNQIGIFSDKGQVAYINEARTFCNQALPLSVCSLVWNKANASLATMVSRYLSVFSPEFLVVDGEVNETFLSVERFGQFSLITFPFFVFGIIELLRRRKNWGYTEWLTLCGLLYSPLPSILSGDPQKVRLSPLLPFLVLTMLFGIVYAQRLWKDIGFPSNLRKYATRLVIGAVCVLFVLSSASFFVNYYFLHTVQNDNMYQSYVKHAFEYLEKERPDSTIYVKAFFSDPTMFYAFYTKMPPQEYQEQIVYGDLEASGFQHIIEIDTVKVRDDAVKVACEALAKGAPAVYVTNEWRDDMILEKKLLSSNSVLTYGYIYDALASGEAHRDTCTGL